MYSRNICSITPEFINVNEIEGHNMKSVAIIYLLVCSLAISLSAAPACPGKPTPMLNMRLPVPMSNNAYSSVQEPCSGGDPSPGPSCRCYVHTRTGVQECVPKSGSTACDYDADCGSYKPGLFTSVPQLGLSTPAWHTFML